MKLKITNDTAREPLADPRVNQVVERDRYPRWWPLIRRLIERIARLEDSRFELASAHTEDTITIERLTAENAAILKTQRCETAAMAEQYDKLRDENITLKAQVEAQCQHLHTERSQLTHKPGICSCVDCGALVTEEQLSNAIAAAQKAGK